jgi:hypothetical protein
MFLMDIRTARIPILLLLLAIMASGCGDTSTQFVSYAIPRGQWRLEKLDTGSGVQQRHMRNFTLSDTLGVLTDTFAIRNNGLWEVDSTAITRLVFLSIGDGYQRAIEIHHADAPDPDSLVRYWYFFKRNDSLYSYTGMRFLGNNPGLKGSWSTDRQDSTLLGEMTWLNFFADSVTINHRSTLLGNSDSSFGYHINLDTLSIDRVGTFYGDRFEVVPGFALYITTHAGEGMARKL